MQWSNKREIKNRENFNKKELERIRRLVVIEAGELIEGKPEMNKELTKTHIRNRCIITGRGRGIINQYRISRIELKKGVERGALAGLRKSQR